MERYKLSEWTLLGLAGWIRHLTEGRRSSELLISSAMWLVRRQSYVVAHDPGKGHPDDCREMGHVYKQSFVEVYSRVISDY
jgi:hypothetical protein